MTDRATLEAAIMKALADRGPEKSICPSEVARSLAGPDEKAWRLLMHPLREAAKSMARAGRISILRKGRAIAPEEMRGVIRLALPREGEG